MKYSKNEINKAGECLKTPSLYAKEEYIKAQDILTYFRIIHVPVLNTFQALLRNELKRYKFKGFVAQRLKRAPSIVAKLKRESSMQLARMQDIAGIRVVLDSLDDLKSFNYNLSQKILKHNVVSGKDYILTPKKSGYRGIHKIYNYNSIEFPDSNGLRIELQIRTKLQHAWATAVETMGTFINYSLKSSEGPEEILDFFKIVSSAFAYLENTTLIFQYAYLNKNKTFEKVMTEYYRLTISEKLRAFTVAADHIKKRNFKDEYYLIVLDIAISRVRVTPFAKDQFEKANTAYTDVEKKLKKGNKIQAVLVSIDNIDSLQKAYPNYFLDTREFIAAIELINKQIIKINRKRW